MVCVIRKTIWVISKICFKWPVSSNQWKFSCLVAAFALFLLQRACFLWKHLYAILFQVPDLKSLITDYYPLTSNYSTKISGFKILTVLNVLIANFNIETLSNYKEILNCISSHYSDIFSGKIYLCFVRLTKACRNKVQQELFFCNFLAHFFSK